MSFNEGGGHLGIFPLGREKMMGETVANSSPRSVRVLNGGKGLPGRGTWIGGSGKKDT